MPSHEATAAENIPHLCPKHDTKVQKAAPEVAEAIVQAGISLDTQFIGKKLDKLIQVIEANTAQATASFSNLAVDIKQDASEIKPDINNTSKATYSSMASSDALRKSLAKKALAKQYTTHVILGLNKLLSDIEIAKESSRRIIILDTANSKHLSGVTCKDLEKDMADGWKELDCGVRDAFKKAGEEMLDAALDGAMQLLDSSSSVTTPKSELFLASHPAFLAIIPGSQKCSRLPFVDQKQSFELHGKRFGFQGGSWRSAFLVRLLSSFHLPALQILVLENNQSRKKLVCRGREYDCDEKDKRLVLRHESVESLWIGRMMFTEKHKK
ncbi:hypothetical protein BKA65DRAFT_478915 [Rhexocercosporidium sp. MPI-PUGE-AT-0058]|nr:hypothetical protein BKA65DRAFT_478915 [Rhexocercosporidium sp. MPI-PUGE-AT-0058]